MRDMFTHASVGAVRWRGAWYLFTGDEDVSGTPPQRIPPGRRRVIRAFQHAHPRYPDHAHQATT